MSVVVGAFSRLSSVRRLVGARMPAFPLVLALTVVVLFKLAISDGGRHAATLAFAEMLVSGLLGIVVARGRVRMSAVARPVLVVLAVATVTAIGSVRPDASIRELQLWLLYLGIALVTASALTSVAMARRFLDALTVIAGWLCLIALFMYWGAGTPGTRWFSTFYWPNPFAALLLLVLPLTLVRFLRAPELRDAFTHGLTALLFVVSLVLTYSRGAWVALGAVALPGMILLRPGQWEDVLRRLVILVILASVSVVALVRGPAVQDGTHGVVARAASVADLGDYSIQGRLNFWRAGLEIFRDHPVFGTGPGTFGAVHAAYQRDVRYYARDAHSLYVQAMAEMGAPGLAALAALLAAVGNAWRQTLRAARGKEEYPLIVGLGLGVVAFFLHSAIDMDWMFPAVPAMAFGLIGVLSWYNAWSRVGSAGTTAGGQAGARAGWTWKNLWSRGLALVALVVALVTTYAFWVAQRHFVWGQEATRRGEWSNAVDHYAAAVWWDPLSSRYLDAYAGALLRTAEPRRTLAADALRRAMRVDRMNAALPLHLAAVVTAGRAAPDAQRESEELMRRALELDRFNRPETYRALASLYKTEGRYDEAEQVYRNATALYLGRSLGQGSSLYLFLWPDVVGLVQDAASLSAERGKVEPAARILEQLLAEDPTAVDAAVQLSALYVRLNRYADARALLEATARRVPNHPAVVQALNALQ